MYERKSTLQLAVSALRMMRDGYDAAKIRQVAKMYGLKVADIKPLLEGGEK